MSKSVITEKRYGVYGRNSFGTQIGRNFKAVREAKGMTHKEAAKGMGLPVSSIYYDLEDSNVPTLTLLTFACDFYGCTPNDILMQEQGANNENERLASLIEAAKNLRQALIDSEESGDCGEIHWAERMTDPVDLLVKALNDYEATNE